MTLAVTFGGMVDELTLALITESSPRPVKLGALWAGVHSRFTASESRKREIVEANQPKRNRSRGGRALGFEQVLYREIGISTQRLKRDGKIALRKGLGGGWVIP